MDTGTMHSFTPGARVEVNSYLGLLRVRVPQTPGEVEVHVGASADFTPSTETLVGSLVGPGTIFASTTHGEERWVRVGGIPVAVPAVAVAPVGDEIVGRFT